MKENKQICGRIEISRNGNAFLIAKTKGIDDDIFISKKDLGQALHGDEVCVELTKDSDKSKSKQGIVMAVSKRDRIDFSGVLEISKDKKYGFVRTSGDKMPVDFFVPIKNIGKAESGDLVVVRLHKWSADEKSPTGIVLKVLGKPESHEAEMGDIMFRHDVGHAFPLEVDEEVNKIPFEITEKEILRRRDMRGVTTVCIDPSTALDKDDAISFEVFGDEFEVGVHISDVTFYVKFDSELANEGLKRGTSTYLVDRVIPLFPSKLSNGICSLNPGQDKLSLSAVFRFDKNGEIISEWFGRAVVNISKDYSYEQAQEVIENIYNDGSKDDEAVLFLNDLAKKMRNFRIENNSLTINGREPYFELDKNGVPIDVKFKTQKEANNLIEEFMLLANRRVDEFVTKRGVPMIHRIHEKPSLEKLETLSSFIKSIGFNFNHNSRDIKEEMNSLLAQVKDTPYEKMVNELIVRSMSKAKYSTLNTGHYGLGFGNYTHFTSPIRRFSDYIVHLILIKELGNDGYSK